MKKLVLIGAGGHSRSVADCLPPEYELIGYVDENKKGMHNGLPIFGRRIEDVPNYQNCVYFVSIGDNAIRKIWFEKVTAMGLERINIIDRTAIISPAARLGVGNFIGKYAVINAGSVIGDDNVINTRALVEHECVIGDHVHLSTGAVINGNVTVGDGAFLGSMSVCIGQLSVGESAVIGAGGVVIGDVPPRVTAVGVPVRIIRSE